MIVEMYAQLKYQRAAALYRSLGQIIHVPSKFNPSVKCWNHNLLKSSNKQILNNGRYNQERSYLVLRPSKTVFLPKYSNVPDKGRCLLSTTVILYHGDEELNEVPETVHVTFIEKSGTRKEVIGKVGERAMYLAHRKGVDMEGACEASLACTTCHCYIDSGDEHWDLLPEATEKEEDLLDMAPFLAVNSRLGCQIILAQELDGMTLRLPRATKNFYVDGHKPEPH